MPFTASHPAAVLPFVRVLPAAALVCGSMAPDFPYFAPLPVSGTTTHSWLGVVTVDVLLAAAAWAVWSFLVGPAFVALTPPLRARLDPAPRSFALLLPAFVLGAATHVAWDSFTHAGMTGVTHVAALRDRYGPLPGYAWAQYAGSLAGGVVITWWAVRWWRTRPARQLPSPRRPWESPAAWLTTTVAALAGALWGLPGGGTWTDYAYDTTTTAGGFAAVTALLIAVAWRCTR